MSVTSNTLGTNTTLITLSGETSPANFITALDAAIVHGGWSQLDVSNQFYRVYQSLNLDGTTNKIFVVQIDPVGMRMWTTSFETWDPVGHAGTNEVWTYNRTGMMGWSYSNCDVVVMASSHWCVLQTFIRNQPSVWSGVFELMREGNEDTVGAGYPCWCWTSSALLFCQPGTVAQTAAASTVSLPRTRGGLTGSAAAINNSLITPLTRIGYTGTTGNSSNALSGSVLPTMSAYGWNATEKMVHTARVVVNNTELHGRILGLKLTSNIGNPYNVASMTVDSQYNYSPTGSAANFWVLGANPTTSSTNVVNFTTVGTGFTVLQSTAIPGNGRYCVSVGLGYYVTSSTGVYYVDASGATLAAAAAITGITQDCWDIVYDNVRYVYVATTAGLAQIDTQNNNAVVFITNTTTLSLGYLCWDGTFVWACGRTSVINAPLYKIDPIGQTATTYNATNGTAAQTFTVCTDGTNAYYVVGLALYKVTPTGTVSLFVALTVPSNVISAAAITYNGQYLIVGLLGANTAQYSLYQLTTTGTVVQNVTGAVSSAPNGSFTPFFKSTMNKIGVYDSFTVYSNSNLIFSPNLTSLSAIGATNIGATNGNQSWYSFYFDGNRAFGTYYSVGTFGVVSNILRPDENATTYGRLLLPQ